MATGLPTKCALGYYRPSARSPARVAGDIGELKVMDTGPLGSVQWFTCWPMPMYADGRKCAEGKGKAPLTTPAGFGSCLRMGLSQMCRVDGYGDPLGHCEVSESRPALADDFVFGSPKV